MSQESAKAFYEKLQQDEDLSKKIEELKEPEAIKEFIQGELGYDFTQEEMQQVIFENNPELTDEELEAVVGGDATAVLYAIAAINTGIGIGGTVGIVGAAAAAAAA